MPEQRRKFSPQFKAEAVQMVLETGKPIAEIARDLGIHEGTLGNWVNIWRRENPEPTTELTPVERARVKETEGEIRRLRMENEFLKKQRPSSRGRNRSRSEEHTSELQSRQYLVCRLLLEKKKNKIVTS